MVLVLPPCTTYLFGLKKAHLQLTNFSPDANPGHSKLNHLVIHSTELQKGV